jgi:heme/copper-type cytochrome/quinol oxidase subunit 4
MDTETAISIARAIGMALACYNLTWSFSGIMAIVMQKPEPLDIYRSAIAFFCLAVLSFGVGYFLHIAMRPPHAWYLFSQVLIVVAAAIFAWGRWLHFDRKFARLWALHDNLDELEEVSKLLDCDRPSGEVLVEIAASQRRVAESDD